MASEQFEVVEYFRGSRERSWRFESRREAEAFKRAQGDEPGVELVIYEY